MPLVPPYIEALRPYEPGRSIAEIQQAYGVRDVIKLASNENPLGTSPMALEAMHRCLRDLHIYPSGGLKLREELAARFRLKVGNVIVGSGSDSIMANIIRTFLCDDDEVLTTEAAFAAFTLLAKSRGVPYRTVPYKNWTYDLEALAEAINERTKIIYLANPNNPTGTMFTKPEFDRFYKHVPERVLILLDEAYYEYARDNQSYPDSMQYRYDNVITLRTFSKAYGLAGLRVGYGFAHEDLIGNLLKIKLPFEPGTLGEVAAMAALEDRDFLHRTLAMTARSLRILTHGLQAQGFRVVPSEANFVMVLLESEAEAMAMVEGLLRQGIIVRPLKSFGIPQAVRISTGTEQDMERCLAAVANWRGVSPAVTSVSR